MPKAKQIKWDEYTKPLNINGLKGRVLDLPAKKKNLKRQVLLIYGHHASIERMHGLAEEFSRYGAVTVPDLPGFGGMDSFYTLGENPTIDSLADYLASFIKMRYKNRRITIIGMSFGFVVATRMLQKYPEIAKKVDICVSLVGFAHHEDFKMSLRLKRLLRLSASLFTYKATAFLARYLLLNRFIIRATYLLQKDSNAKMKGANNSDLSKRIAFEIKLWQCNDVRTYCYTGKEMLKVNLCTKPQLNVPLVHVQVAVDRYFNNIIVEQHLGVVYEDVALVHSVLNNHAPTIVSTAEEAAPFIPSKLRTVLRVN